MNLSSKTAGRPCPVCDGTAVGFLRRQTFILPAGHLLPDTYDVVCCEHCGFCYADTPARQADYDRYYADFSKYEDNQTSTGGGGTGQDLWRLGVMADQIADVLGADRTATILDIGCANGGLLAALRERGFHALTGIDPSPACVANTAAIPGVRALPGVLTALPPDLGKHDLVVLSHVLEHVADLPGVVASVANLLREGGRLYVEVPDATRYAECLSAPFQDFNVEHINHFSLQTLGNLLAREHFVLESGGQKTLQASPTTDYPAAFGFFRRGNARGAPPPIQPDFALRHALGEYVARSSAMLGGIEAKIADLTDPAAPPFVVWGTGQLTLRLLAETRLGQANVAAFVDGNPINQGKTLRGVPVLAPAALSGFPGHPVLIGSQLHHAAILHTLRHELCLDNLVVIL